MAYTKDRKQPTVYTIEKNCAVAKQLGIDLLQAENEELTLARAHCIKRIPDLVLKDKEGNILWRQSDYSFVEKDNVPDSVNPSLWINTKCLYETGIFSVVGKDIIQVRGFDVANISFVRSKTGWIVLDAGTTVEGSAAAIAETEAAIGEPIRDRIRGVIISHSHSDHFGGIGGIISPEQAGRAEDGKIPIYVAKGFDEATRDEYVYAGAAMSRRSHYQVGANVERDEYGKLSIGCGFAAISGTGSYIHPTNYITEDTTEVIDGITVDFQLANETEAVANMQNYFHEYNALWVADDCIGTMHNIYTMRGAKIRDAKLWSEVLYDAYVKYGEKAEVVFQGHAWPHWKTKENPDSVKQLLLNHAAAYQFIHDQSLLYLNQGDTAEEIAGKLDIPDILSRQWYLRPYYGDYELNARAIYNKYLGFYDGNPVHLRPLTPVEEAKKFIEYVGSEEAVLEKAKTDFDHGNYQYAAQAANYVVFSNPDNIEARYLCADALEQLGYQSESAIFRNAYLNGAYELRENNKNSYSGVVNSVTVLEGMDNSQILDYFGLVIDGNKIADINQQFILQIKDQNAPETYLIQFFGGALLKKKLSAAELQEHQKLISHTVITTRRVLIDYISGNESAIEQLETEDKKLWERIFKSIVPIQKLSCFAIIEP